MNKFRDIPGFEGYYQCSVVTGEIRSVDRYQEYVGGRGNVYHKRFLKGRTRVPQLSSDGIHYCVTLSKEGKTRTYGVQQLIALTYPEICGEWFEGAIAHHIDGNPSNNSPYNIRVISREKHVEEHWDKINRNLIKFKKNDTPWNKGRTTPEFAGKHHPNAKPVLVYTKDFNVIGLYDTAVEAARVIGCSQSYVSGVCLGKYDSAKGLYCEYL